MRAAWKSRSLPVDANALTQMTHPLQTPNRKCTDEPVFGIIKAVMGFCQVLLRGVKCARGEWNLICLAWNLAPRA